MKKFLYSFLNIAALEHETTENEFLRLSELKVGALSQMLRPRDLTFSNEARR